MTFDRRRVLVVNEDEHLREMLSRALRERSLSVEQAANAAAAVQMVREQTYSVVLLDTDLISGGGGAVLQALPEDPAIAPVVLVMAESDLRLNRNHARRIHAIFRKPCDQEEVAEIIVACADVRARGVFETMAVATVMSGAPFIALL